MRLQIHKFNQPILVVGDIHGQAGKLKALLELVPDRPVVTAGDVGDRGPDTKGVLDLLVARKAIGAMGNHDEWLRILAMGGGFDNYALDPCMGGKATLASYDIEGRASGVVERQWRKIPVLHREWLQALAVLIDLEVMGNKFWVFHTGIPPYGLNEVLPTVADVMPALVHLPTSTTLWVGIPPRMMKPVDRPVIMGHMVQREPLDLGHIIAIDTGCGIPGGKLTGLLLPERTFVQV